MNNPDSAANAIMQYSFLKVFADDDTIDAHELAFIERLALRDGVIDDEEREAIKRIFAHVSEDRVTPEVWAEIQHFKKVANID